MRAANKFLSRLITKLSDAELAEKVRTLTPATSSDAFLIATIRDEASHRERRKARKAG